MLACGAKDKPLVPDAAAVRMTGSDGGADSREAAATGTPAETDSGETGADAPAAGLDGGATADSSVDAPAGGPWEGGVDDSAEGSEGGSTNAEASVPAADSMAPDAEPDGTESLPEAANSDSPIGPCAAVIESHPIEGSTHVAVCSPVTYLTKPPSSGNHYPIWAAYQSYASAIPEGFWVHNLEHGAVVVSYDCPGGCASDVAAAQAWIDGMPDDPLCVPASGDARIRMVMTPDPNLDVRFAASAWGWTLRANCFDPVTFGAFVQTHYNQGPEVLCSQGLDLSLGVQDGCGE